MRFVLGLHLAVTVSGCATSLRRLPEIRTTDIDGDGRVDRFETLGPRGDVLKTVEAPAPGSTPAEVLLLGIDGVPYDVFAKLQAEGLFREFFPAAAMVAPFPSLTDVGWTALWRTPPCAAYEDKYYDPVANKVRGGLWDRFTNRYKHLAPFHERWDWEAPNLWGGLVYVMTGRMSKVDLRTVERKMYEGAHDRELILYLGSTDAVGHKGGPEALAEYLRLVHRVVRGYMAAGGGNRRVVLFSDHGQAFAPERRFDLRRALKRAGYRVRGKMEGPKDVVTPTYGLVGSIQLYTRPGEEERVARAIVAEPGCDFAVWRTADGFGVATPDGSDELPSGPDYPDLRRRVEHGVRNHTRHPANVFVSLQDGWHFGSRFFEMMSKLKGTHGNARRGASLGIVVSNVDRLPEFVPAEDAFPYFGVASETGEATAR